MDHWVLPLGLIAVSLVLVRLAVLTVTSFQRAIHQKKQNQLALDLMRQRINTSKRQSEASTLAWNGYRKFVIARKIDEAAGICSFYLVPHDGKPLPAFKPGQYLTFRFNIPGRDREVIRCYSLSDAPMPDCYRVTIKRVMSPPDVAAPPGLVSNFFHEQLHQDDILDVQAPRGHFVLDPYKERPAVLIAGGVGVTPLFSMLKSVVDTRSGREILFFYGVRNRAEHALKTQLEKAVQEHANIRQVVCYSQPTKQDKQREGRDYHYTGWLTIDLIRNYLQSTNYEFYICGPPRMMETITHQLAKWGVAKKDIYTEAFGPATVSQAFGKPKSTAAAPTKEKKGTVCQVTFSRTGRQCGWSTESENLLDFALSNGIRIDSGCRAGNCGTCVVAIKSGRVAYLTEYGAELEEGTCLACIAAPDGDLVLDA